VGVPELNKLYDYDYALVSSLADLAADAQKLKAAVASDNKASIKENVDAMGTRLDTFEATFRNRMLAITGTEA
jgi:hypothetical protein